MATTIQVVENLTIGKFIEIEGKRCEVEAISFTPAITENARLEELLDAMSDELISLNLIDRDEAGNFYWTETGESLVQDEPYEDE
ncbi:TPA: hypothetical protein AB5C23_001254 [Vibrio cholerae]|uniref:hypothetical protein n=1 Tax=Vibrio paracholerae TaxID=650003 RepID=UPI00208A4959|nr:hypothetical protein [Vibrio paracholerae]MCO7020943.1 hypothetical protein [Vibrio paracholerae]GHX29980.1 hypothetical protein VCSRO62_0336 [Vibrio cholerae]